MKTLFLLALLSQALFSPGIELQAADSKTAKKPAAKTAKDPNNIAPTHKNVKYGAHQKELVNFWQVESKEPLGEDVHLCQHRKHSKTLRIRSLGGQTLCLHSAFLDFLVDRYLLLIGR